MGVWGKADARVYAQASVISVRPGGLSWTSKVSNKSGMAALGAGTRPLSGHAASEA